MSQPIPHDFQDAKEIADRLLRSKVRIDKWFAERIDSLQAIVSHAVGGNTFRAFRHMPQKPSAVFRAWALVECKNATTIRKLKGVRSQADYDKWLKHFSNRLNHAWQRRMGQAMPFGPMRKLPNLLLKEIALWTGLSDGERDKLIKWLHVPLDKYTLVGIRRCIDKPEIPRSATMKFVTDETMYNRLQVAIRRIARRAGVPAIYFDNLAWNSKH
jgi:hypothetical protein